MQGKEGHHQDSTNPDPAPALVKHPWPSSLHGKWLTAQGQTDQGLSFPIWKMGTTQGLTLKVFLGEWSGCMFTGSEPGYS